MRIFIHIFILTLGIGGFVYSTSKLSSAGKSQYNLLEKPPLADLDTPILDILTLGHRAAWDDVAAIWLVQILTEKELRKEDPKELLDTIMSVLKHRPKLETIYMMACFTFFMDMKYPEGCEPITMAGLDAFPRNWLIPVTQAYVYGNDLNDDQKSGIFYRLAASKKGAPKYLGNVANKLLDGNQFTSDDAINTLKMIGETEAGANLAKKLFEPKKNSNESSDDED